MGNGQGFEWGMGGDLHIQNRIFEFGFGALSSIHQTAAVNEDYRMIHRIVLN
jgi:hypothetical protein